MMKNRNIGMALFQIEKTTLLIILMILVINMLVNGLVTQFNNSSTIEYFMDQWVINTVFLGFLYLIIFSINQVITAIPFLVSLNCAKKELAKNINIIGVSRSLIITIIIMALKVILGAEYWVAKSMFGINLASGSVVDNFTFAAILFVLLLFVYSLSTFISLVAVNKGWEYFLSVIFILLGSCFFIFKSLVLLFLFGRGLATLLVISVILTFMINLINYKFINNFEYKS